MTDRLIRVAVQSRRRLVREALGAYLDGLPEFDVVGQTADVLALPDLCALRRPDVAVADVGRLTVDTVEALRTLRVAAPSTEIVLCYVDIAPPALDAAARAGITALVPASRGLDVLLRVLRRVATPVRRRRPDGSALTQRELEIATLLGAGHNVPEMAGRMGISPRTVENHKRRLYAKLGVGNSSQAVSRASALGLLEGAASPDGPLPRRAEQGRPPLVVAHGTRGPCLDQVALGLVDAGLPFVLSSTLDGLDQAHWARWHRGPLTVVLVDPGPEDWTLPAMLAAPAVVVHSTGPDLAAVADALLHGAQALVRGAEARDDLAALLTLVGSGYFAMDAAHIEDLTDWLSTAVADRTTEVPALTTRERDILVSIADGHTVLQTARSLGIAKKTVESTQARLFRKLGARNRAEALAMGHRLGLVDIASAESLRFRAADQTGRTHAIAASVGN
ncbi:MAG: two-component system, NarL family, nitrate/nitrite response regulator NarL [Micromonosporaceae bacterium]